MGVNEEGKEANEGKRLTLGVVAPDTVAEDGRYTSNTSFNTINNKIKGFGSSIEQFSAQ